MNRYVKKSYGNYKTSYCPFCNRIATQKNAQGLEVCYLHLKEQFPEIKCSCGSWLELKSGSYGAYFNCAKCGNINFKKGLEMKSSMPVVTPIKKIEPKLQKSIEKEKKEITITSNDYEYFS